MPCSDVWVARPDTGGSGADRDASAEEFRACCFATLIAGFPAGTSSIVEVMEFIDEMEFDRLGCSPTLREEDTPAASMPDQIDEDTKLNWQEELMELQQEIAF